MDRSAHMVISRRDVKCKVIPVCMAPLWNTWAGVCTPGSMSRDTRVPMRTDSGKTFWTWSRPLEIPIYRYPGGAYASSYYWEDSVGPVSQRKRRVELSWQSVEPNTFGVEEFSRWSQKAGGEVMMTLNLATRGIQDALNQLEYCNLDTDTYYARLRRQHGRRSPTGSGRGAWGMSWARRTSWGRKRRRSTAAWRTRPRRP